ncbi:phosphopantetheine-binding protein [Saccharothrix coeruleofusca]|uniref:Carrier domain-containing protein n=1 Tax=Saccharothrix coeruleofusca TaxID=33919 RepID=A0A918EIJ3_9PSEU|nr:phosphopantetheine-binding protein [Saccharothrix coeruleofusca]MBP2336629.1 polyketide biosynthesis acyl carrier protein [Saccharothrix coeruleofusca]GGP51617.1 hypothetical protein GCM10010185_24560 [Saccharothrix coeruleofusca]GGP84947.1 hypothetical protein GCM10010185_68480 [Saccharothrix coeruleofusca]
MGGAVDESAVLEAVRRNVLAVVPDLDPELITPDRSLADLGCNSIDRADVAAMTVDDLGITVPVAEFGGVADIGDLVRLLVRHC